MQRTMPAGPLSLVAHCLLVCFGVASFANSEIYTKETLPNKPKEIDRAFDATLKIARTYSGGLCTAVATSPDGYVLTNLHCVMPCLVDHDLVSKTSWNPLTGWGVSGGIVTETSGGRYRTDKAVDGVDGSVVYITTEEDDYRIRTTTDQSPKNVVCDNYRLSIMNEVYDGTWYINEQFFYGGRIVWLGRGNMVFSDENVAHFTEKAVRQLRDSQDDFAILKFELPKPVACMPVSPVHAKPGDKVWVVGYPMFAKRDSGFDSPGHRRAVSFGTVRGSIAEDLYLRNQVEDFNSDGPRDPLTGKPTELKPKLKLTVADWLRLQTIYESPDNLLTDLDAMPGNSGSMVINQEGAMVGLLHSGVAYSTEKHLGATVTSLRINTILNEVRAGLGEKKYREIFSCPAE